MIDSHTGSACSPCSPTSTALAELVHEELQRHAILQPVAHRRREAVHQARNRRAFLRHRDEQLTRRSVLEQAHRDVALVARHRELVRDRLPLIRHFRRTGR